MDEIELLASERKSLKREVVRMEREFIDFSNRLKVMRGGRLLSETLKVAAADLVVARARLATFDRELMGG